MQSTIIPAAAICMMILSSVAGGTPSSSAPPTSISFSHSLYALWTVTAVENTTVDVSVDALQEDNTSSLAWADWIWKDGSPPSQYSFVTITMGTLRAHAEVQGAPVDESIRLIPECDVNRMLAPLVPGIIRPCSMSTESVPQEMHTGETWRILVVIGTNGRVDGNLSMTGDGINVNQLSIGPAEYAQEEAFHGRLNVLAGVGELSASPVVTAIFDCSVSLDARHAFGFFWGHAGSPFFKMSYDDADGHHDGAILYPFFGADDGPFGFNIDEDVGGGVQILPANNVWLLLADVEA